MPTTHNYRFSVQRLRVLHKFAMRRYTAAWAMRHERAATRWFYRAEDASRRLNMLLTQYQARQQEWAQARKQ
jgi:hypothetical protein